VVGNDANNGTHDGMQSAAARRVFQRSTRHTSERRAWCILLYVHVCDRCNILIAEELLARKLREIHAAEFRKQLKAHFGRLLVRGRVVELGGDL